MRILLVHQNFPGQFRDLAPALLDRGHELKAIACNQRPTDPRIDVLHYGHDKPERSGIHTLTGEVDDWLRRGTAAAEQAQAVKQRGWAPDVMLAHPGWGEALFLKQVFDATPLVVWPELWLRDEHLLDPPQRSLELGQRCYLRSKNWLVEAALSDCELAVLPTQYQADCFPLRWQHKIRVLHEGVQDQLQQGRLQQLSLGEELTLTPEVPVLSFASRNLEPLRGFDRFLAGVAWLQPRMPALQTLVVGAWGSSYSGDPQAGCTWKDLALQRLEGQLDLSRIHFIGHLPHSELIKVFRRSDLHTYLSRSFVLSWSLLEAIACGTPVLADTNPMLLELKRYGGEVHFADSHLAERLGAAMEAGLQRGQKHRMEGQAAAPLNPALRLSTTAQQLEQQLLDLQQGRF